MNFSKKLLHACTLMVGCAASTNLYSDYRPSIYTENPNASYIAHRSATLALYEFSRNYTKNTGYPLSMKLARKFVRRFFNTPTNNLLSVKYPKMAYDENGKETGLVDVLPYERFAKLASIVIPTVAYKMATDKTLVGIDSKVVTKLIDNIFQNDVFYFGNSATGDYNKVLHDLLKTPKGDNWLGATDSLLNGRYLNAKYVANFINSEAAYDIYQDGSLSNIPSHLWNHFNAPQGLSRLVGELYLRIYIEIILTKLLSLTPVMGESIVTSGVAHSISDFATFDCAIPALKAGIDNTLTYVLNHKIPSAEEIKAELRKDLGTGEILN